MSENEGGESRSVGAFLLGFLTGVLVCLGIGFGVFVVGRRSMMEAEMNAARAAEAEARMERDRAEVAALQARFEREKTEKALLEAKKEKDKQKKDR